MSNGIITQKETRLPKKKRMFQHGQQDCSQETTADDYCDRRKKSEGTKVVNKRGLHR